MTDITDIEADIEQTRAQLGETVDLLAHKLDVKSQVTSSAELAKERAVETVTTNWREIAVVGTWAALVVLIWKKA